MMYQFLSAMEEINEFFFVTYPKRLVEEKEKRFPLNIFFTIDAVYY